MSVNFKSLGVVGMKFVGEYDATATYKKLQVVTDPTTGDSYGSKVDGNTGNALSNTTYWFKLTNTAPVLAKINDMTVQASGLAAGSSPTVTITESSGHKNIAFGIPKGDKGDKGDTGDPAPAESITTAVDAYLEENFSNPSNPPLDRTLASSSSAAPADLVGDLKSAFNSAITNEIGKNLFDGITESGYLKNDGTLDTYSDWVTTDYIKVSGLTAVTTSGKDTNDVRKTMYMFYLCTYNSSKTFIENVGRVDDTYTVGSGVSYIRFSYHSTAYSELQVESGTSMTGYTPYVVNYKFTTSKYIDEYNIDLFNRFNADTMRVGEYINSSGIVGSDSSAVRSMVPCKYGEVLDICRPQKPNYSTGNGLMLVYDSNMTVLASVNMETYATIYYNSTLAVRYPVTSQNAAFVSFNVKLASYDSTSDTVVTARNINGEYTGDYINELEGKLIWAVNGNNGKWKGKKWVCVGDSLTDINERTTKHYFDYVADETGISIVNMGNSGSGYAAEKDLNTAFFQRITSVPTDADAITIFGSFNDLGSGVSLGTATDTGTNTIGGCINTCLDNLFDTYPLAIVGVVSPTPWVNANPTSEPNNASNYVSLLETICKNRSIPFLDLFHCSLLRPWDEDFRELAYSKDEGNGVHPDETGHKIIAPRFKAFLETLLM